MYVTNYIVTPWKVTPKDWDKNKAQVKAKVLLGSDSALRINTWLSTYLAKANTLLIQMITEDAEMNFVSFRERFTDQNDSNKLPFHIAVAQTLTHELDTKLITKATSKAYTAAVTRFTALFGDIPIWKIRRSTILDFKRAVIETGNENLASQYTRNLKAVYHKTRVFFKLKITEDPFADIGLVVTRISDKKTLTVTHYKSLYQAFEKMEPGTADAEILRRFLIMCRGIRYSDTCGLNRSLHYFEVDQGGEIFRFFQKKAQKSNTTGIVPITARDAACLIRWEPNGMLFPKINYQLYSDRLKVVTQAIIGVPLTTHFGRHFAGDFIINSENMLLDDVKTVLGVSRDTIAEVYARRDVISVLKKFYKSVADLDA